MIHGNELASRIKGGGVAPASSASTSININPYLIFQNNLQKQQQQQQHNQQNINGFNGDSSSSTTLTIPSNMDAAKLMLMQNVYSQLVSDCCCLLYIFNSRLILNEMKIGATSTKAYNSAKKRNEQLVEQCIHK